MPNELRSTWTYVWTIVCQSSRLLVTTVLFLQTPVIFTDANLVTPAVAKWNLDYLADNLGDKTYSVYESKDYKFKYFDEKKAKVHKQFQNPMKRVEMKFQDFVKRIRAAKPDDTPK